MKCNTFLLVTLVAIVLVSGCASQDITPVVKNLPQFQAFLKENPNADIKIVKLSESAVTQNIAEINAQCGEQMEVKSYYKAIISEGDDNAIAYLDAQTQDLICFYRKGKPVGTEITTPAKQPLQEGGIESSQGKLFETAAKADIIRATYNISNEELAIFIQNTDNAAIPLTTTNTYPTTEWIVFDSNQRSICSTSWAGSAIAGAVSCTRGCGIDIAINQIRQVKLNLRDSACSLSSQPAGSLISFTIDFSGKTTAGGSFEI